MTAKQKFPLNQIYFYLTEGCNLRCRHCWIAPKHQAEGKAATALAYELFRHIVDQAKPLGLSGVKLTGGEPLDSSSDQRNLGLPSGPGPHGHYRVQRHRLHHGVGCKDKGLQGAFCFGEPGWFRRGYP